MTDLLDSDQAQLVTGAVIGFAIGALAIYLIRKTAKPCGCHDEHGGG